MATCAHVEKGWIAMLLADVNLTHDKLQSAVAVPWRTTTQAVVTRILLLHSAGNIINPPGTMFDSCNHIIYSSINKLFLTQCSTWRTKFCITPQRATELGQSSNAPYSTINKSSRR